MTITEIKEVLKQNLTGVTPYSIACQLNYKNDKRLFNSLGITENSTLFERTQAIKKLMES